MVTWQYSFIKHKTIFSSQSRHTLSSVTGGGHVKYYMCLASLMTKVRNSETKPPIPYVKQEVSLLSIFKLL